mmetsp:Transcript_13095/g.22447  ORF Transcript_13095/g.22447 Transcript_13095/m.22447 type:complete len:221 (-) Transcript_13095:485-1147(-)
MVLGIHELASLNLSFGHGKVDIDGTLLWLLLLLRRRWIITDFILTLLFQRRIIHQTIFLLNGHPPHQYRIHLLGTALPSAHNTIILLLLINRKRFLLRSIRRQDQFPIDEVPRALPRERFLLALGKFHLELILDRGLLVGLFGSIAELEGGALLEGVIVLQLDEYFRLFLRLHDVRVVVAATTTIVIPHHFRLLLLGIGSKFLHGQKTAQLPNGFGISRR